MWNLLPDASLHARVDSLLARAEMTKASDGFLLVKVCCCSFHPPVMHIFFSLGPWISSIGPLGPYISIPELPDGDHFPVDPKRLIPGDGGGGGRALVQLVKLEGVIVKGGLRCDPSLLIAGPKDPTKKGRLPLALSTQGARQKPEGHAANVCNQDRLFQLKIHNEASYFFKYIQSG